MKDKQKQADHNRLYRLNNKDKIKQIQDAYYQEHRKDRILNAQKWVANNKEKALQTRRLYMKTPNGRLNSIKSSAKTRGIEYHLSDEEALSILGQNCFYCDGKESIGIDRVDSSKGYATDNTHACCYYL